MGVLNGRQYLSIQFCSTKKPPPVHNYSRLRSSTTLHLAAPSTLVYPTMQLFKETRIEPKEKDGDLEAGATKSLPDINPNAKADREAVELDHSSPKTSVFKGLGWLDRLLALWILLAMIVGILLGNFVPNTGPALQKGKFVGVSVPIGSSCLLTKEIVEVD